MSFDWDEILVLKDPDNKEVSVNFKAVDGTPYPGSPASELCVRIYSNETFTHITGSAHWVWLELSGVPDRYVKVRLDFDSGNGIEPPTSPQYAEFYPGDERTLQFALSAGEADDLLNSSNYRATASIAGSSCAVSQATVEFVKDVIPPDPDPDPEPDTGGDGEDIPPDPKPECEPQDCDAVDSLLSTNPEYADGLWFLTSAEQGTKAATGGTINGIISLNKNLYDNTPVPLAAFAGTPVVIGQSLGTGPCYTDRVYLDVPFGGAQARWTSTPSVNFWTPSAGFGDSFFMNYSAVLYCPPNEVMTFFPIEFQCGSVWQPSGTGGPTITVGATANIDRINNTMTINYPHLPWVRTRSLTDIEAATGVVDFEHFYYHQWYQEGAPPDEFGNPQYALVQIIRVELSTGGVSMIPKIELQGVQLGLDIGDLKMASSGGIYPNILQGANVLWAGDLVTDETAENKYQRITEIRTAIQRSWQDYTPPTYCERIP